MDISVRTRVLLPIMSDDKTDVLRLPKKHTSKIRVEPTADDGSRLVKAQSIGNAIAAGMIVVIVFSMLWAMLSDLIDRVLPWLTLVLGLLVGLVVRRAGHGLDWRFPLLAGVLAVLGALVGNIVVAATATAAEFETGTLTVLRAVTSMTWPEFFGEKMTPADWVFALFAAIIASVYAKRRLTRKEYLALRKWQEANDQTT